MTVIGALYHQVETRRENVAFIRSAFSFDIAPRRPADGEGFAASDAKWRELSDSVGFAAQIATMSPVTLKVRLCPQYRPN